MRKRRILAAGLLALSMGVISGPARAIEPITDALLDRAESNAKSVIARAEQAGDAFAKSIGEQALLAIKALRESVRASINEAKGAALEVQRQTFDSINSVLEQARQGEKVILNDVMALTATISDQVKNLPFVNHAPEVMLYQPRVLVPQGAAVVPLRVIGPKLAASQAKVAYEGKDLPVDKARDVELVAHLDRSRLPFDETRSTLKSVRIAYDQAQATWWKPWTWFASDIVTRDMTLLLLPHTLGTYTVAPKLKSSVTDRKTFEKPVGGSGKDGPMYFTIAPDPLDVEAGWKIDVEKVKQKLDFRDTGGHDASCVGLVEGSLKNENFTFQIQHGHKTDWAGHKSDASKSCSITVPLIKVTPTVVDGPEITGRIGWSEDVRIGTPAGLASYVLSITLFDGRKFILDRGSQAPYGLLEIEHGESHIRFRPKPPLDF